MKSSAVVILLFTFILAGCGVSSQMQWAKQPLQVAPTSAKMVFIRDSFVAGAIDAKLYRVVDNKAIYLGTSTNGTQVEVAVEPGHHIFMASTGSSYDAGEFMEADVLAGKTYYTIVTPNWGVGHFFLHPVHRQGPAKFVLTDKEFRSLKSGTKPVELKKPSLMELDKINASPVIESRYAMFRKKPASELTAVTTRVEDGE